MQATTDTGSVLNLAWTSDGTQVAGAGANGNICVAHLVGLTAEVGAIKATLTNRNSIEVYHLLEETKDELDFQDRVIKMCLGGRYSSLHGVAVDFANGSCFCLSTRNANLNDLQRQ